MLIKHERRVLYLLRKHGGRAQHSQLTQAMHRISSPTRDRAIANCEELELISSAKTPPVKGKGGPGGLVYWLTEAGHHHVQDLIDRGEMEDPKNEPRAGAKGERRESG